MKYTRDNVPPEAIVELYAASGDTMRDAAETRRQIEAWHRRRDPAALDHIIAKLNEAADVGR